jgi:hypothetical protein
MDTRFINKQGRGAGGIVDGRMYGRLGTVTSLNDILQLLGMNQRTATVRLDWRGQTGRIYFREGVLLHATAGSAEGDRALVKLMRWEGADFVVEDGIEGKPPESISKRVDAAMLDVMTRLDEGWIPEMTPFPMLNRVTTAPAVLDPGSRPVRTPPKPRRVPRRRKPIAAAVAAALVVAMAAIVAIAQQGVDLGALPTVSTVSHPAASPEKGPGVASDVLRASLEGERGDSVVLLEAHGVVIASSPETAATGEEPSGVAAAEASMAPIAAAPKAPELGQLLVIAEPWASVAVDGVEKGETPLSEMTLPAGNHEILLSNPNFVGVIRDRVEIRGGQTLQRKYSFDESGSLRILVKPWADVFVDGRFAGQTPLGALRVPPGKHTIVLRHPALGEKTAVVEVTRNRESLLEVEM